VTHESVVDRGVNSVHGSDIDQHFDTFCDRMH
jgi:hypothetical protein